MLRVVGTALRSAGAGRMAVRGFAVVTGDIRRTTGIVGLEANDNAREDLVEAYGKIMTAVEAIPADAHYRKTVEATTKYRLGVVESTDDWGTIEDTIGCGQLEELLFQANCELDLIPAYAEAKLWEDPPPATGLEELH